MENQDSPPRDNLPEDGVEAVVANPRRPLVARFIGAFLAILAVYVFVLSFVVQRHTGLWIAERSAEERMFVTQVASALDDAYQRGAIQIHHLDSYVTHVLDDPLAGATELDQLAQVFAQTLKFDDLIDQIRLLDPGGREIVRVNRDGDDARILSEAEFQDKSGRVYFHEAAAIKGKGIYLSALDLKVENGEVEWPPKAVIRFAAPVHNASGEFVALVVLNTVPLKMITKLADPVADRQLTIVDADGRWIYGGGDRDFAHLLKPGTPVPSFAATHPDVWQAARDAPRGALRMREGLYAFALVDPFPPGGVHESHLVAQNGTAALPLRLFDLTPAAAIRRQLPLGRPEFWVINSSVVLSIGLGLWFFLSRRETTRALHRAALLQRDTARRANRFKSDFMARMSHEIRTPLNGVMGMVEAIADYARDPRLVHDLGVLRTSGRYLMNLVQDILDVNAIEQGTFTIDQKPFRPCAEARAVQQVLSSVADQKGIDLVLDCAPAADGTFLGDPQRLSQVLFTLVGNAIEFTSVGEVAISVARPEPGWLEFRISDTGSGMRQDDIDRIFCALSAADSARVPTLASYGLGLQIVWGLVRAMEGTFRLESAVGQGTTAVFRLPMEAADRGADLPAAVLPDHRFAGLRVLLADDIQTNQFILAALLRKLGMQVVAVNDGAEALARWEPGAFDLVLLDIMMPRLDGVATLEAIGEKAAAAGAGRVVFVAVTANAMPDQIASYRRAGFDACVTKPVMLEDLVRGLEIALRLPADAAAPVLTGQPV